MVARLNVGKFWTLRLGGVNDGASWGEYDRRYDNAILNRLWSALYCTVFLFVFTVALRRGIRFICLGRYGMASSYDLIDLMANVETESLRHRCR